jgi:hypothetical protein
MSHEYTEREIHLIEELGIMRRLLDVHKLIEASLITRLGGEAKITHAELEHTRQNYVLIENIQVEDYCADILIRVRLK